MRIYKAPGSALCVLYASEILLQAIEQIRAYLNGEKLYSQPTESKKSGKPGLGNGRKSTQKSLGSETL